MFENQPIIQMIGNKYKIEQLIGAGTFGSIYKGMNIRTDEYVAIKVEPVKNNMKTLKNETRIYQHLKDCKGIPVVRWFGTDHINYYMVLDLLGDNLEELLRLKGGQGFPLMATLKIGIEIIKILQGIHIRGLIHRDVKPDNFLIDFNDKMFKTNNQVNPEPKKMNIYLIDFGFCKGYTDSKTNEHIEIKQIKNIIGTPNYISVNGHNLCELSRRDDIESVGYMLIYFYLGHLPWKHQNINEIKKTKENIIKRTHDYKIPGCLIDFLINVRNLEFKEEPYYNLYITSFLNIINKKTI